MLEDRAEILRRELFLRAISLARPPVAVARALAQAITDVYFEAGDVIYTRGDPPDAAYFLVEGDVTLETPDDEPWFFSRGAVVGILDVNLERPRARTAIAQTHVHAMRLSGEDWLETLEDNFEYTIQARNAVARDSHKLVLELAPSGGFEEPEESDFEGVPELNAVARLVVLKNVPAFATASVQALASVAALARTVELAPGQTLFDVGEPQGSFYVVATGIVDIERGREPVISAGFGPSSLIGGTCAFGGVLSEYRARARTACSILCFTETEIDDVAEDHFDLVRSVTKHNGAERERLMRLRARARASGLPLPPREAGSKEHSAA